ncbi:hypothetical protein F7725_027571 [Dissostichus mawsoni]|uniref:Uncharacterized protein n=1 Tax=Dissostichus mawsoni TaxID=36200 RepID=A0A7J5XDS9_DISMA|nr:hypothetical protein F7725_027571 [Dissostichus mawsoni]
MHGGAGTDAAGVQRILGRTPTTNAFGPECVLRMRQQRILGAATVSPTESLPLLDLWMWISLGVSTFILIILLVVRRSNLCKHSSCGQQASVPSARVPVDTLKKASSSQNLRNPSPARRCHEDKRRCKL